jgi:hypothetical protein
VAPGPAPVRGKKEPGTTDGGVSALPSPFIRVDFCEKCWIEGKRPEHLTAIPSDEYQRPAVPLEMFSFWKTTMPLPQQKKKLLVDDSVLMDVFSRMEGKTQPQEVRFRFVLALILMRKRLLKYEGMVESAVNGAGNASAGESGAALGEGREGGTATSKHSDIWRMMPRGEGAVAVHVIDPHLTAEQISDVSGQLSAILAEEV